MPALLEPAHVGPHLSEDARRGLAGKLPRALPLRGGFISTGKASPAERLPHSRGGGRDWAAEGCRDASHAVQRCCGLLALCTHPPRLCLSWVLQPRVSLVSPALSRKEKVPWESSTSSWHRPPVLGWQGWQSRVSPHGSAVQPSMHWQSHRDLRTGIARNDSENPG